MQAILTNIAFSSIGEAVVRKPEGGFAAPGLEQLFKPLEMAKVNVGSSSFESRSIICKSIPILLLMIDLVL